MRLLVDDPDPENRETEEDELRAAAFSSSSKVSVIRKISPVRLRNFTNSVKRLACFSSMVG